MPKPCKYCGGTEHTSLMCFSKPRRPLKAEAERTKAKRQEVSQLWFALNPPDSRGLWYCYLQISPDCPVKLTRSTVRQEHVKAKVRYPELRHDVNNLRPACDPCNKLKGSRDLEEIPEWQEHKAAV